jgi:regulatory protein
MDYTNKKTKWTKETALVELKRWCAAEEKSHFAVRNKLIEHQIYGDDIEEIIAELISENFLNELRFAMAYVSGKFKINKWGRNKIKAGLKQRQISSYNTNKAMGQIVEEEYLALLFQLFNEKKKSTGVNNNANKLKLVNYLLQKGFEQSLIMELLNKKN